MARAFLFPGQGSQAVGMGQDLARAFPTARDVFAEVDEALKQNLSRIMWDGPEEAVTLTENAQPALMAVSMAIVRVLENDGGKPLSELASYVAGHSLGEYSALAAVRSLCLADAARLLKLRGRAMQRAVPVGQGAMAALLGADLDLARAIALEAAAGEICDVANDNGGQQVVLSGAAAAIDRAIALAEGRGVKRAVKLQVSAPFHCALMAPAADAMAEALSHTRIHAPTLPVVANVTAAPVSDPGTIRDLLVRQVTSMVRWRETVEQMATVLDVASFAEIGSGKVLTGLAKRIAKGVEAMAINTPADIDSFLKAQ